MQDPKPMIKAEDQYVGRTEKDLAFLMDQDRSIKVINDGLSVSLEEIISQPTVLTSAKENLCKSYQLAAQSLCSDVSLHTRQDRTRHEGVNVMEYSTEAGSMEKGKGKQVYQDEDEDRDAYDLEDSRNSGLVRNEQAGVVHLVHGWIQQGQPQKVSLLVPFYCLVKFNPKFRVYIYLKISLIPAPACYLQALTCI